MVNKHPRKSIRFRGTCEWAGVNYYRNANVWFVAALQSKKKEKERKSSFLWQITLSARNFMKNTQNGKKKKTLSNFFIFIPTNQSKSCLSLTLPRWCYDTYGDRASRWLHEHSFGFPSNNEALKHLTSWYKSQRVNGNVEQGQPREKRHGTKWHHNIGVFFVHAAQKMYKTGRFVVQML